MAFFSYPLSQRLIIKSRFRWKTQHSTKGPGAKHTSSPGDNWFAARRLFSFFLFFIRHSIPIPLRSSVICPPIELDVTSTRLQSPKTNERTAGPRSRENLGRDVCVDFELIAHWPSLSSTHDELGSVCFSSVCVCVCVGENREKYNKRRAYIYPRDRYFSVCVWGGLVCQ
jgi:hypothetical protein